MPTGSVTPAGGTAFNGGTITNELVVDTGATTTQAAQLKGTRVTGESVLTIDYPNTSLAVTSDGAFNLIGDGAGIDISTNTANDSNIALNSGAASYHSIVIGTGIGIEVAPQGAAVNGLVVWNATKRAFIVSSTKFALAQNAAPADADLAAGQCALWFDQTNGAAKLMVKAKTANGTVATGSLALT